MKKSPKIVQVYGNDGGALYINGKLISEWFTVVQSDILEALGFRDWECRQLDQKWYNSIIHLPKILSKCKFKKIDK